MNSVGLILDVPVIRFPEEFYRGRRLRAVSREAGHQEEGTKHICSLWISVSKERAS